MKKIFAFMIISILLFSLGCTKVEERPKKELEPKEELVVEEPQIKEQPEKTNKTYDQSPEKTEITKEDDTFEELPEELEIKSEKEEERINYNGFEFVKEEGFWNTAAQKADTGEIYQIQFRYNPYEVEDISVTGDVKDFLWQDDYNYKQELFITFDPDEESLSDIALASSDLSMALATILNIKPTAACTRNDVRGCEEREVKNCDDEDVIYLKKSSVPKISVSDKCILIEGSDEDLLKASAKVLMIWYGFVK